MEKIKSYLKILKFTLLRLSLVYFALGLLIDMGSGLFVVALSLVTSGVIYFVRENIYGHKIQ